MANARPHDPPVPQKAIDFLAKKIRVETEKWDDLKWGEHAHAFTVAHSAGAGVLDGIHRLLNKAVEDGVSFQEFRNGMLDSMKKSGWYGGAGHTADEKRYVNWRIGVIYDTNMRTAYAQANYREQLEGAELRPVWVYQSQLAGDNRRQEHIALHGRAFRYDDPFWDTYYPPNGWGCECYVNTESEHGAEKAGIKVEDSKNITLPEIDGTWAYNAGREALAPNFTNYKNLPESALKQIYANYRDNMDGTRMVAGEFKTLLKRANEADYKPLHVNYQVGNLEARRFEAMRKAGVEDSKIMAVDSALRHGAADKTPGQRVNEKHFDKLYEAIQEPDFIYEQLKSGKKYRAFHFVKVVENGKIKAVVYQKDLKNTATSLQVITIGEGNYEYEKNNMYKKIW
jgi:hypothetical protein